jgi:hypothetical protein
MVPPEPLILFEEGISLTRKSARALVRREGARSGVALQQAKHVSAKDDRHAQRGR